MVGWLVDYSITYWIKIYYEIILKLTMDVDRNVDGGISKSSHGTSIPSRVVVVNICNIQLAQFGKARIFLHPAFYTATITVKK